MSFFFFSWKPTKPYRLCDYFNSRIWGRWSFEDGSEWEKKELGIHPSSFAPFLIRRWVRRRFTITHKARLRTIKQYRVRETFRWRTFANSLFTILFVFLFLFSSFFLYLKAKRIYTCRSLERQFVKSLSVKNFNIDLVSTQTF